MFTVRFFFFFVVTEAESGSTICSKCEWKPILMSLRFIAFVCSGAALLRASFDYFPSLNNVRLPGLGIGLAFEIANHLFIFDNLRAGRYIILWPTLLILWHKLKWMPLVSVFNAEKSLDRIIRSTSNRSLAVFTLRSQPMLKGALLVCTFPISTCIPQFFLYCCITGISGNVGFDVENVTLRACFTENLTSRS